MEWVNILAGGKKLREFLLTNDMVKADSVTFGDVMHRWNFLRAEF